MKQIMTNEKNESEVSNEEKWTELVKAVLHNGLVSLRTHFDDVDGQVLNHEIYGPVFVYRVKDVPNNEYACGFLLRELVTKFQSGNNSAQWMASFFFDLMKTEGGRPLPKPPETDDEAKKIVDMVLIPQITASVQEEFAPQPVHTGLDWTEQGPVFEAGFPEIRDGNNVCAFPLQLLLTHLLLNRDPADLILQAMYTIREQHGMNE